MGRWLIVGRLGHSVGMVEEEDGDLLVRLLADVHAAMNAVGRLVPVNLARPELDPLGGATIAVFNGEGVATQNHSYPMKMGRGARAWLRPARETTVVRELYRVGRAPPQPRWTLLKTKPPARLH